MTTATTNGTIAHTDSTTFRAWGLELHNLLVDAGWAQSSDTGQADWTTAVWGTTYYEIFYLNDSLHETAPIYVKITFGTGSSSAYPHVTYTVGKGTDGAGTLTSTFVSGIYPGGANSRPLNSTTTSYPSYACCVEGCMWFLFKAGARSTSGTRGLFDFAVVRTVDDDGTPTATGFVIYYDSGDNNYGGSSNAYSCIYETGVTYSNTRSTVYGYAYTMLPYVQSNIYVGSVPSIQVTRHYCVMPDIQSLEHVVSSPNSSSLPIGTTFTAAIHGSNRTFISTYFSFSSVDAICLIWE